MRFDLKSTGWSIIGIGIAIAAIFLAVFFIKGGVWLAGILLPWLSIIMWLVLTIDIFIILPLGIFKRTKSTSAIGLLISSYIYGLTLWLWGLLLTYLIWGTVAVLIGLFIFGVGVVPMAILATALKGEWSITIQLIVLLVLTFGSRAISYYIARRVDELALQESFEQIHTTGND